jgi:hypothetical protein
MEKERLNKSLTVVLLLVVGALLVVIRFFTILLPLPNLFEVVLFLFAGYLVGNHVYQGSWKWGLVLSLPALFLLLYFLSTPSGIGLRNILSLFLIPLSSCFGIELKNRRTADKRANSPLQIR